MRMLWSNTITGSVLIRGDILLLFRAYATIGILLASKVIRVGITSSIASDRALIIADLRITAVRMLYVALLMYSGPYLVKDNNISNASEKNNI